MPPNVALIACLIFILYLLRRDPASDPSVKAAIWVPLLWMLIQGSRLPSQWMTLSAVSATDAIQDGNPFDRTVYLCLIVLAVWILASRSVRWGSVFSRNSALTLLIVLGLVSVIWSDFPFIAFKRWIRDLGTYLMIVVLMTEERPLAAVEALIRKFSYILIPLSVLLIKYYPQLGMAYDGYTGAPYTTAVTTNKNMLGVLCLVSALFFTWDILRRFTDRKDKRIRKILLVDCTMLVMTLWILGRADSSTSLLSYVVAVMIMLLSRTPWIKESPPRIAIAIPVAAVTFMLLDLVFGVKSLVTGAVGRDSTFTGRTNLWNYLGNLDKNWLLGAGYETFWMGPRLDAAWKVFHWGPTEAHNGYLEMYIELGLLGIFTLALVLLGFYRRIYRGLSANPTYGVFCFSFFVVLLIYNWTEAAFRNCLLWFTFLTVSLVLPVAGEENSVSVVKPRPVPREMSGPSKFRRRIPNASH